MILIIDFGSQFNQLIARRVREHNVYCIIEPPSFTLEDIKRANPEGIILSGSPASIYDDNSPETDPEIFNLGIPVLGICYGMHFMTEKLGGKVEHSEKREYGFARIDIKNNSNIFKDIQDKTVWMSHGDSVIRLPEGFEISASTQNTEIAAIENIQKNFYALQFHPEVVHSVEGTKMIDNFISICGCKKNWTMESFAKSSIKEIKKIVGDKKVILGLSGGVDSSVAAVLIHKAIGKNLQCIFVDNGLLRKDEKSVIQDVLSRNLNVNINFTDASQRFLSALEKITDPEKKRQIIGNLFIEVFEESAKKIDGASFLAQGTLYPDVIESKSAFGGPSAVIKSHHNVGGLPEKMELDLLEPLLYLFKDEVRALGSALGLTDEIVWRQPFPGPGLAIRILGEITKKRLDILRNADYILREEIKEAGYYKKLWQAFVVLLPVKTVGVMGDKRTYENTAVIRAVESKDAMTADWAKLPYELLGKISNRIINEVRGINRVAYDISSKPPATIEWE
ncbi:MAG: glutamine-hydrolyzing GMP synthase [Deltaproteobacteria bacterium]|nr:MAG: glutamine-hydrolyzing GMP synthase [Deltaproteobacteria bacterium]